VEWSEVEWRILEKRGSVPNHGSSVFFMETIANWWQKNKRKPRFRIKKAAQKSVFMKSSSVLNSLYFKKISFSGFNRFISFNFKLGFFFTQVTKSMEGCWNGS